MLNNAIQALIRLKCLEDFWKINVPSRITKNSWMTYWSKNILRGLIFHLWKNLGTLHMCCIWLHWRIWGKIYKSRASFCTRIDKSAWLCLNTLSTGTSSICDHILSGHSTRWSTGVSIFFDSGMMVKRLKN